MLQFLEKVTFVWTWGIAVGMERTGVTQDLFKRRGVSSTWQLQQEWLQGSVWSTWVDGYAVYCVTRDIQGRTGLEENITVL